MKLRIRTLAAVVITAVAGLAMLGNASPAGATGFCKLVVDTKTPDVYVVC